jgi:hypothetical protein
LLCVRSSLRKTLVALPSAASSVFAELGTKIQISRKVLPHIGIDTKILCLGYLRHHLETVLA